MRPPDHAGTFGVFWELEPGEKTVAHWVVEAPGQAIAWNRFVVAVLDLEGPAPLDGSAAVLDFEDARWEVAVWALEDVDRPGWPDDPRAYDGNLRVLTPQNVRVQLPAHPAELVADATRAVLIAALAGIWGFRLEPLFTHDQTDAWRAVLEETIRHPLHEGEDRDERATE